MLVHQEMSQMLALMKGMIFHKTTNFYHRTFSTHIRAMTMTLPALICLHKLLCDKRVKD